MSGFKARAGFIDASTWTDSWNPVTTPVDTMIPLVSESLTKEFERLRSAALTGSASEKISEQGIQLVTGDLTFELDYNNAGLLYYAMGDNTAGVHILTDDLDFFHLTIDRSYRRYYFLSCLVNSMTISAAAGDTEPVKVTLNVVARISSLGTTEFPSISLVNENRVYWDHIAASGFLADEIANTLTTADARDVKSVEFVVSHNYQIDGRDTSSNTAVIEPKRNGWRKVTAKFSFARYGGNQSYWTAWKDADTSIHLSCAFVDGGESIVIAAPECKIVSGANFNVSGPGIIEGEVDLECHENINNSNSSIDDQLQITVS